MLGEAMTAAYALTALAVGIAASRFDTPAPVLALIWAALALSVWAVWRLPERVR